MQVDPDAAVEASGSRLIVTTTQSLADVDPSQVTVTPATPFVVDTSGRSVGVRFALPLWDDTEYTVVISDVEGLGGGPAATITESFRTPPIQVELLQRGADGDTIFRTDLSGENAVAVFTHPHIEDFRATSTHLVVSVRTDDDRAGLRPGQRADQQFDPGGEGEGLVRLRAAERHELLRTGLAGEDVTVRDGAHRDVRDERSAIRRRHGDGDRIRPGQRRPTRGVRETWRRVRGDDRDQAGVSEPPGPCAQHARGEARLRNDDARVLGGIRHDRIADRGQRQMPESAAPVPALEARRALDQLRLRSRVALALEELFEPRDSGQALTASSDRICCCEVLDDGSRRPWSETCRAEPLDCLSGRHDPRP